MSQKREYHALTELDWVSRNNDVTSERSMGAVVYSAYEMKKFLCLFERPFKIQKNGVFLFEISFFVLEILTFFYYAVMTSYGLQLKSGKY